MTFEELYKKITKDRAEGKEINLKDVPYDENQLNCLLYPDDHPLIIKTGTCQCKDERKCVASCLFNAIEVDGENIYFNKHKCTGCGECINACDEQNLKFTKDSIKVINMLKNEGKNVYALIAPAFIGQFGEEATPDKIRSALYEIGFTGLIEVAAFADILTLKEALEFAKSAENGSKFQISSCCCPIWIALIKKVYTKLSEHLPPAVSPMIACGRIIKQLHPDCLTVFIGPCMAKKAEAREKDVMGAIDAVLTFRELQDIFSAFKTDFSMLEGVKKEHSSKAGRIYAKTSGVSQAVSLSAKRIDKNLHVKPIYANGIKECRDMLEKVLNGEISGNFYEGMGCIGGCVGGPGMICKLKESTEFVEKYAEDALYATPMDNPYVLDLIKRLGFSDIHQFIHKSDILTREF